MSQSGNKFFAAIFFLMVMHVAHAKITSPLEVLRQDFHDSKYWPKSAPNSVEFCGGDWCQEVSGVGRDELSAAWDAVFIIFYFADPDSEYQRRRDVVLLGILNRYDEQCSRQNLQSRSSCVLDYLSKHHGFGYWRVQYDVGHRCTSKLDTQPPYFTKEGECS